MLCHKASFSEYDKSNAEVAKEVGLTFTFGSRNQVFFSLLMYFFLLHPYFFLFFLSVGQTALSTFTSN